MAKDLFWITVAAGIVFITMSILIAWPTAKTEVAKYDCRVLIGGWHPDVPAKVIEECRKRSSK
jgi:hypothetical protein